MTPYFIDKKNSDKVTKPIFAAAEVAKYFQFDEMLIKILKQRCLPAKKRQQVID